MRMRWVLWLAAMVAFSADASADCPRSSQVQAIDLSNDADKARSVNLDDAIAKYVDASALDPTNDRILYKLALAYQKKEAWDRVTDTCAKAERVAPTNANYFLLHGVALGKQSSWDQAKAPLTTAAKLDPNAAEPHFQLGHVALHLDDEQGAIMEWNRAIKLEPNRLDSYLPLADLYLRLHYTREAALVVEEANHYVTDSSNKNTVFALHTLAGIIDERKSDWSGALREYQAAKAACGPCNEAGQQVVHFNLGTAYLRATPPDKSSAATSLMTFQKMICRGGAAARYANECMQAQQLLMTIGNP